MRQLFVLVTLAAAAAETPRQIFEAATKSIQEAGVLAQQGKFGPANELMASATASMEKAIAMDPEDIELRARRGIMFSYFPPFMGKADLAAADLKAVATHPKFLGLAEPVRQQVNQRVAALSTAPPKPDRFPRVSEGTSPVIAAASISWQRGDHSKSMDEIMRALDGYPGLLGRHLVRSVDHSGMYIVFTWWKDKKALNDWFYGGVHQSFMKRRGSAMNLPETAATDDVPSQVAMEVFAGLPGGIQINGGFIPAAVFGKP